MIVITLVNNQIAINQPAEPTCLTISALTINIPEPIIEPTTSMVPSNNPNSFLNSFSFSSIFSLYSFDKDKKRNQTKKLPQMREFSLTIDLKVILPITCEMGQILSN